MISVGIGEIQRNTSLFANLSEAIQIVDKRKKKVLAMVYPVKGESITKTLAGKYHDRIQTYTLNDKKVKEEAMFQAMKEKYGLPS
jgi:tricorn protease-like protein